MSTPLLASSPLSSLASTTHAAASHLPAHQLLFPWAEYWWAYAAFVVLVGVLLALDLGVFHRRSHVVSMREAGIWTGVWVGLATLFGFGLYAFARYRFGLDPRLGALPGFAADAAASRVTLEYFAGLLVEKALAVDNLFVFVVVLSYFKIPEALQHRVLFYGILGALVFRAAFIALGAVMLSHEWVIWALGAFLVVTGLKLLVTREDGKAPGESRVMRLVARLVPVTPTLEGAKFFVRRGRLLRATPLFLALLTLELMDVVFALDSVPAIFAITREPFIVFTSNIFAILGLRSMYFFLAALLPMFAFLKHGLGLILVFVGLKMAWLNDAFGGEFPILWSLGIIGAILAASIGASLLANALARRRRPPPPAAG
jgi:tellurite resistance protein TerC